MSSKVRELMASGFGELRHEPTAKRIQAVLGGETIVDSTRAVLVWEPRRIVPSYAVPVEDVRGELVPADAVSAGPGDDVGVALADVTALRVLDPRIPFSVHSTAGEAVDLRAAGQVRPGAGFRPDDPDLAGLVILDFAAFDAWYEEDELNVAHPRDPFHRIDVLPSSRQVRLELDGQLLAVSSRPVLLFETMLPTRYYLPRADVTAELVPSSTRTWCAYKGQASYFSASVGGRLVPDIAWSYPDPEHDATRVRDLIAFFDERIDVVLDGERRARPVTPWSDGSSAGGLPGAARLPFEGGTGGCGVVEDVQRRDQAILVEFQYVDAFEVGRGARREGPVEPEPDADQRPVLRDASQVEF